MLLNARRLMRNTYYLILFVVLTTFYLILPSPALAGNSGIFTVSLWVKPTSSVASQALVGKSEELRVFTDASGNAGCQIKSTTWQTASTGTTAITLNSWNHVACAYDKSTLKIYVNGVLANSGSLTATIDDTANAILIGQDSSASTPYSNLTGTTDDFKFYNYARTQKQVIEDMGGGHPGVYGASTGGSSTGGSRGGPVAYYKFDEGVDNKCSGGTNDACNSGSGGSSLDGAGSGFASPATSTSGWTQAGKFGKALNFDGTNDYVTASDNNAIDITNTVTVSAWVKPSDNTVGNRWIAAKGQWGGDANGDYFLDVSSTVGKFEFTIYNGTTAYRATDSSTFLTTAWYHVVGVWDGSTVKLYVNGVEKASTAAAITLTANAHSLWIGGTTGGNALFPGSIDEVKIYPYALTADEVKLDYNQGSATVLGALGDNTSYQKQAANQEYCIPGDTTTCTAPVGRWDFNEKSGQTAYDTSGNANNGTLGANSSAGSDDPTWTVGKKGAGLSFDGTADYITVSSATNYDVTGAKTVSVWFKLNTINTQQVILAKGYDDSNLHDNYEMYVADTNKLVFGIQSSTTSYYSDGSGAGVSGTALSAGVWYHAMGVYIPSTSVSLYLNGKLDTQYTTSIPSTSNSTGSYALNIGRWNAPSPYGYFNGSIDDVRIFNYARSAAQIAWDYNRGAPVGWWKFDEGQGGTLYDSSGNGNKGTWSGTSAGTQTAAGDINTSGTAWANGKTGKRNYSLNFDGSDDYVSVGNSTSLQPATAITIEVWVKPTGTPSGSQGIIDKQYSSSAAYWAMWMRTDRTLKWEVSSAGNSTNYYGFVTTSSLSVNIWHHVVAIQSGSSTPTLYIDNVLQTLTTDPNLGSQATVAQTANSNSLDIGKLGTCCNFSGQIDDVKIYNYALTATQVKLEYNQGAVRFGPSTGAP